MSERTRTPHSGSESNPANNQRSATMTSDVRYASGEVPQVGDVVECLTPCGDLAHGVTYTVSGLDTSRRGGFRYVSLYETGCDLWSVYRFKLLRQKGEVDVARHSPDKPATFVPTWGPEWEYVTNNGTAFTFLLDDKSDVAPIKLTCEFGDVWFSRDGAAAFGASWVIISQRPRTPAPVETPAPSQPADVPQESAELTTLRADLARAKEDGERMEEAIKSALKEIEQYTRFDFYMWLMSDPGGRQSDPIKKAVEAKSLLTSALAPRAAGAEGKDGAK